MIRPPTDRPGRTFRERIAAHPWLGIVAGLMIAALLGTLVGPDAWREHLMLVGWGLVTIFNVGLARQAPRGSRQQYAQCAFAGVWAIAFLQQGVLVARHAGVLSWASEDLDLPLLVVGSACLVVGVVFTVRSGRPRIRQ